MLKLQRKWYKDLVKFGFHDNVPEKTRANFRDAYKELNKMLSNIQFKETEFGLADSKIKVWPSNGRSWLAWAYYPISGDIGLSDKYIKDWKNGNRKDTIYHEVGHSIGFAHTFSHKELLADPLHDSRRFSVLAYKHRHEAATFQAVDIQSFRSVYGTKPSNTGNNMYVFKDWIGKCIIDDGGTDTLDFRGVEQKIAEEMVAMLREKPDGTHLSLAMSKKKWVGKLDTTTFEYAIMPDGEKISLTDEPKALEPKALEPKAPEPKAPEPKAPEPKALEPKAPRPIFAIGEDKINHKPEFEEMNMANRCVILSPISRKGHHPATGIITSIELNGFTMVAKEPERLDGFHAKEEVAFTVLNIGEYQDANIELINSKSSVIKLNTPKKYIWAQIVNQEGFNYCVYNSEKGQLEAKCEGQKGSLQIALVQSDNADFLPYPPLQSKTYWRYRGGKLVDGKG